MLVLPAHALTNDSLISGSKRVHSENMLVLRVHGLVITAPTTNSNDEPMYPENEYILAVAVSVSIRRIRPFSVRRAPVLDAECTLGVGSGLSSSAERTGYTSGFADVQILCQSSVDLE